ncbi:type IV pilus modification PilV family protein [Paracidovorax oryzae]|uniref:type IV pilus modification PilV family protein n=1 Tax=Paracidovorax oryzae TaxID=862720 RepID=UPI0034A5D33E
MNAHIPHSNPRRPSHQRGVSMIEVAVWSVILGVVVATVLSYFNGVKGGYNAGAAGEKIILLTSEITKNWSRANDYSTVSPTEVNKLSLIKSPLRYDSGSLYDGAGNTMDLNGSRISFALTVGGSSFPLNKDDCATIVSRIEPVAVAIRIGTSAAASAGVISGGNVYKSGGDITQTGLTTGCSEPSPKIAAQFR